MVKVTKEINFRLQIEYGGESLGILMKLDSEAQNKHSLK